MPRRVLWLCWLRPALKLANQTRPPLPSWPPSPPAIWETRKRLTDLPNLESNTTPWRTSLASSPTPSHQATVVRMFKWQRGLQIKQLSGCQMEAPAAALLHVRPFLPIPSHPAPALLPCTLRASPTDKAILLPRSPRHTPRARTWTTNLGARSRPVRTVATTALAKKTQTQRSRGWTGLS